MMLRMCVLAVSIALAACGEELRAPRDQAAPLVVLWDSLIGLGQDTLCYERTQVHVVVPPHDQLIASIPCVHPQQNVSTYLYSADEHGLLIVGREYTTTPDQLRELVNSLEVALTRRFGVGRPCPNLDVLGRFATDHIYWEQENFAVMMRAVSLETMALVGFEAHLGLPGCSDWMGSPAER